VRWRPSVCDIVQFAPQLRRNPLGSRVRIACLLGGVLIAACDPARVARFEISPRAVPAADSAVLAQSRQIVEAFATRYQLQLVRTDSDCPMGRYFAPDSIYGRQVGLNLCVRPAKGVTVFDLSEFITSRWGPKGAALRRELRDTLLSRFGAAAVRER